VEAAKPSRMRYGFGMSRFEEAIAAFDAANAEDPNRILVAGVSRPRELVQAERLTAWVLRLAPQASEVERLAARCQHLRRFAHPRSEFPEGRIGYLKWRTELGRRHARAAEEILERVGYDAASIAQVRRLNQKQGLHTDPSTQLIEDALCLVFLEHELEAFAAKHPSEKVADILRKTWKKMSVAAHQQALRLPLPDELRATVLLALAEPEQDVPG